MTILNSKIVRKILSKKLTKKLKDKNVKVEVSKITKANGDICVSADFTFSKNDIWRLIKSQN